MNFSNGSDLVRLSGSRRGTAGVLRSVALTTEILGLVLGVIGTVANASVLALLVRARRMFGNNVISLIANQSAMDLCSCFFYTVTIVLQMTKAYIMQI